MPDIHTTGPAPGFEPVDIGGIFATSNGPLHARWLDDHLQLGFRVGPRHINPGQQCHGGMLGMFADILLSTAAQYQTDIPRVFLPTISLRMDFIAGAPLGSWVQGQADILRVTRNLVFSQGLIHATARSCCAAAVSSSAGRCCRIRRAIRPCACPACRRAATRWAETQG